MSDDLVWNRINHVILPNYCEVGTAYEEGNEQKVFQRNTWTRWLVPVDDTHSWTFGWRLFRPGVDDGKCSPAACGRDSIDIGAHSTTRAATTRSASASPATGTHKPASGPSRSTPSSIRAGPIPGS